MADERTVTPAEAELSAAIAAVKNSNPEFGVPRVLSTLRAENPAWQVSEKRVRKFMTTLGLMQTDAGSTSGDKRLKASDRHAIPKSLVAPGNLAAAVGKGQVEVRYIDGTKGKGVFAARDFDQGTNVFEETPFAWYPRWDTVSARYHMGSDYECQLCAREIDHVFGQSARLRPAKCNRCSARFCSVLCKNEAEARFHKVECTKTNPHFVHLANACRKDMWGAPMGAARAIERVLLEFEQSQERGKQAWESLKAFATVRADVMDERRNGASWFLLEGEREQQWENTYSLMKKALFPPPQECGLKEFDRIPKKILNEMFSYNEWLNLIGKYSLNDQNGGFYLLQSCLNHSCDPNCICVHPNDGKYRSIIKTLRPIKAGEEMFITYVNPRDGLAARQKELHDWYMFDCNCERCQRERSEAEEQAASQDAAAVSL
ncbi:SET domain-containing protein [Martensiomyces pterosporus]|nr:SET domain-containing protein [Martensiomyces pterosporus]